MATQLFLRDEVADTHFGTDNLNLLSSAVGWTSKALATTRGAGVIASDNVATVTGATAGITVTKTTAVEWISPPVSADVTISGTITGNVWASENNMSANVSICIVVEVIRANATATRNSNTLVEIGRRAPGAELVVTTRAVNNFTITPTSTVVNRGDRLRVRLFGDDVTGAVNMATGFTFNASWSGTGAAADGDTYVTFTEDFSFESAPGTLAGGTSLSTLSLGQNALANTRQASRFSAIGTLNSVSAYLSKQGSPVDDLIVELQADSAGSPSGTALSTLATINGASLTTTPTLTTWSSLGIALTQGATYWIVFRRSGAIDAVNYFRLTQNPTNALIPAYFYNGTSWGASGASIGGTILMSTSTLYLTDTLSDVSAGTNEREAWTTNGGTASPGLQLPTTTVAGWTAPIQVATNWEWYTKQLSAFTLAGMAVANLWTLEVSAATNASLRCEIARVDSDGTNVTVWASWCIAPTGTDNGEVPTAAAARTANVSGDDLAFTDGQRIRIRVYVEDISSSPLVTAGTVRLYMDGDTSTSQGDTYITLPQTVTEFSSGPAASFMLPNRNLAITRR